MSNYTIENDENYAAQCVEVETLISYPELSNLVGLPFAGYVALVSKNDFRVGDKAVVFPAECQLSEALCWDNNLYSNAEFNKDPEVKGYLGKNRRVKAIKLRGVYSTALAMPTEVFGADLEAGTAFDTVNGVEVCRKFVPPNAPKPASFVPKKERPIEERFFPPHYDTSQYLRNSFKYNPNLPIYVSQKIHGTNVRLGRTYRKRKLTVIDRIAKWFGVPVEEYEMALVAGSRKVTKDPEDTTQNHWYGRDIWTDAAQRYGGLIPDNHIVYGELIGWIDENTPIQKDYTYDLPRGEYRMVVFRVAAILPDGTQVEYPDPTMRQWCKQCGLDVVPLLRIEYRREEEDDNLFYEHYTDKVFTEGYRNAIRLSDPDTVDEGVVLRQDGLVPLLEKLKGPRFYEHESVVLDTGEDVLS